MTRPRVQQLIRRGGERIADSAPRRAILAALPAATARQFDPAAAAGLEAAFELRIRAPAGGPSTPFAVAISDGRCTVRPGPADGAGASVTIAADDLVRLGSGAVSWPTLLSSGRMELSGDPFLAVRFPTLFRLPASVRMRAR